MPHYLFFGITSLLIALLLVACAYGIFLFYKFSLFKHNLFGETITVRLLTLMVAGAIKKAFFYAFWTAPFNLFLILINALIKWVGRLDGDQLNLQETLQYVSGLFENCMNWITGNLLNFDVLLGVLIAWLLQAVLTGVFYNKKTNRYEVQDNLQHFYKHHILQASTRVKQNVALTVLLLLSLYLVLCVTIAIPYINYNQADGRADSSRTWLQLNVANGSKLLLNTERFKLDTANVFQKFREQDVSKLSPSAQEIFIHNFKGLQHSLGSKSIYINNLVAQYNRSLDEYLTSGNTKKAALESKLRNYSGGKRLQYEYFQRLQDYFDTELGSREIELKSFQYRILNDYDNYIANYANYYISIYDDFITELQKLGNAQAPQYLYDYFYVRTAVTPGNTYYAWTNFNWRPEPKEPVPGEEWGWIGRSASWLLLPNNADLVLIIGMFGFGMLGAAISSYINRKEEDAAVSYMKDLHVIVVRGFSAAIVIFLATKGGIAIINNGSNNPNPHVLFFTCLVGAVFSDRIWEWAKKQLTFKPPGKEPGKIDQPDEGDAYKKIPEPGQATFVNMETPDEGALSPKQ